MHGIARRDWILASACWAEVLRAQTTAQPFTYFDVATAAEVEAIAETILPRDGTPGARDPGVIWFIDRALSGYEKDNREDYRNGLADLQARRAKLFPNPASIAALNPEQRIALLKSIETTDFLRLIRQHTMLGFFGHPKHGENRDSASAKLLRIEPSMHYQSASLRLLRPGEPEMSTVPYKLSDVIDFIVIGSGAAGGVVAKELAVSGFRVVVLERGPYLKAKDFTHDEVEISFRAAIINDPKKQPNTFRRTADETARPQQAVEYTRLVGGGSVHFTANHWRFHPEDFRERSMLGAIREPIWRIGPSPTTS